MEQNLQDSLKELEEQRKALAIQEKEVNTKILKGVKSELANKEKALKAELSQEFQTKAELDLKV